jgi:hypothetical protein
MSDKRKHGVYVYRAHAADRADDKCYAVGGLPTAMTKEEAWAVVSAIRNIMWVADKCWKCGRVYWFSASHCTECSAGARAPWEASDD